MEQTKEEIEQEIDLCHKVFRHEELDYLLKEKKLNPIQKKELESLNTYLDKFKTSSYWKK